MKPRYKFEPNPVVTVDTSPSTGNTRTIFNEKNGRVIDSYNGTVVGSVAVSGFPGKKRIHAVPCFSIECEEIEGEWNARVDLAAEAIWRKYWEALSTAEKTRRLLWYWSNVGWMILGTIIGMTGQVILRNL